MKYGVPLKRFSWLLLLYGLVILILVTTDPFNAPLLLVMVPFGLIFIALLATFNILLKYLPFGQWSDKKRLIIAAAGAWLPVMLLILRSIDQLTFRDGFILAIFIIALLLYISRTNFSQSRNR